MNKFRTIMKNHGIEISNIGFGCWAIGGHFTLFGKPDGWGNISDEESIKAIHLGMEMGVNLFDTADVYGTGHSEEVLGKAIKGNRHKVAIATKFGFTYNETTNEVNGTNVSKKYIKEALKRSLTRLQTEYIDLYQCHVGDLTEDQAYVMGETFEELVKEGVILTYGWSTFTTKSVDIFVNDFNPSVIQYSSNVFDQNDALVHLTKQYNLASLCNSPLATGVLTGKYSHNSQLGKEDFRSAGHSWVAYFEDGKPRPEYLQKLAAIRDILTSNGRTLSQGALCWLLSVNENNIPIPGFKNDMQAKENAGVLGMDLMKEKELRELRDILYSI